MTLNRTQRIIVRIGGCVLLFKLLFPPWIFTNSGRPFGVYFIFTPPIERIDYETIPIRVDTLPLFLQIAAIVTGTALLVWWFHSHQASAQSPPEKTSERGILKRLRSLRGSSLFWLLVAMFLGLLVLLRVMSSNP